MKIGHMQKYKIIHCSLIINILVLIRAYWWENLSEINKHTGTFIRNSRVCAYFSLLFQMAGVIVKTNSLWIQNITSVPKWMANASQK